MKLTLSLTLIVLTKRALYFKNETTGKNPTIERTGENSG